MHNTRDINRTQEWPIADLWLTPKTEKDKVMKMPSNGKRKLGRQPGARDPAANTETRGRLPTTSCGNQKPRKRNLGVNTRRKQRSQDGRNRRRKWRNLERCLGLSGDEVYRTGGWAPMHTQTVSSWTEHSYGTDRWRRLRAKKESTSGKQKIERESRNQGRGIYSATGKSMWKVQIYVGRQRKARRKTQIWEQHITSSKQIGDETHERKSENCSIKIEHDSHPRHRGHRPPSRFDYFKQKFSSWFTLSNLRNANET
jgi:hypothetical protein